jgi:RNA polymerase sigma factor (sigma-70 family)
VQSSHNFPLLTPVQEKAYARRVQAGLKVEQKMFGKYISVDLKKQKDKSGYVYDDWEECADDMAVIVDGLEAKETFFNSNIRLALGPARHHFKENPLVRKHNVQLMDLVQEGLKGVMHAITKFDPNRNLKFSTYAINWINQHISRMLRDKASPIHVPVDLFEEFAQLEALEDKGLSDKQICREMGLGPDRLIEYRAAADLANGRYTSLDKPIKEGSPKSAALGHLLPDQQASEQFEALFVDTEEDKLEPGLMQVYKAVSEHVTETEKRVLERLLFTSETQDEADKAAIKKVQGLVEHPALRASIKQAVPNRYDGENDWRDEAGCVSEPEQYIGDGRRSDKKLVRQICGSCAVRAQCETYFEDKKPMRGLWIDGKSQSTIASRAKRARRQ